MLLLLLHLYFPINPTCKSAVMYSGWSHRNIFSEHCRNLLFNQVTFGTMKDIKKQNWNKFWAKRMPFSRQCIREMGNFLQMLYHIGGFTYCFVFLKDYVFFVCCFAYYIGLHGITVNWLGGEYYMLKAKFLVTKS